MGNFAAESSSDTTSRETTPESDEENEDEDQEDDEDDDVFADEDTTFNRNDPDNEDSIPTKDYQSNPGRDVDELLSSYRHLFSEYEVHLFIYYQNSNKNGMFYI